MNWIEIDKILYRMIERHETQEGVIEEARKQFKWSQSQAEAAVKPLLKRNNINKIIAEPPKKRSKQSTKRK